MSLHIQIPLFGGQQLGLILGIQTSYQGEINPFPQKASLLTFHPFIQYEKKKTILFL